MLTREEISCSLTLYILKNLGTSLTLPSRPHHLSFAERKSLMLMSGDGRLMDAGRGASSNADKPRVVPTLGARAGMQSDGQAEGEAPPRTRIPPYASIEISPSQDIPRNLFFPFMRIHSRE